MTQQITQQGRGRPPGSKNKVKEKKGRGRPAGSKNKEIKTSEPRIHVPMVHDFEEPIRGFQSIVKEFGLRELTGYSNTVKLELAKEDILKAVEKYNARFNKLPTKAILNSRNEKLLPYLHALAPNIRCGLADSTALWEITFQVPENDNS